MSNFKNHLNELIFIFLYISLSLLLTFFTSYFFAPQLIKIIFFPLSKFTETNDHDFIFTNVLEVFNTYIISSLYISLFLNFPLFLYLVFLFIKPGLFKYEKDFLILLIKTIVKFIIFSIVFIYYIFVPSILSFLLNLDLNINSNFIGLKMETKLYDYVIFFWKLIFLYCFVIFQIPTLLILFVYYKQPNLSYLYKKRRLCILIFFIIGCLFSSPDLISLLVISLPLIFFFECVIFISIIKDNYRNSLKSSLESCLNGKRQVC